MTDRVEITSGIEHGELDQNSWREAQRVAQLGVKHLALVHGTEGQQSLLSLIDGDGAAVLLLDDEGTVGLDHLCAARTAVDHGTLALLQGLHGLLIRGELDKGEGHVVRVATDLDPALAILHELAVDGRL